MTLLLPNVFIWTARASLTPDGATTLPMPYLNKTLAHAEPVASPSRLTTYQPLPAGALETDYLFRVDEGTDIITDDVILQCTLLDGVTPWGQAIANQNESLLVVLADDSPAGLLPYRDVYVKKLTGGGPVY